jgi:DNA repair/transcription protein MET18/MMS19
MLEFLLACSANSGQDRDKLKLHIGEAAFSMLKNAVSTKSDCSAYARVSMLQFLQLMVNKFDAGKEVIRNEERNLVKVMLDLTASCDSITDKTEVQHIYHALAYFTAACLSSGDRSTKDLIAQMIDGISHPAVGRTIAQSFRTLLMPSEIMNEQNFCKIRKLRKQRLYELSVDRLVSLWRGTQDKTYKDSYLIALAGVLTDMEPKIVEENAEELLPVILEGTNVKDDRTMFTNVTLIHSLIASCPEVASSHIDSIINRMTHRTHNTFNSPSDASVKCRVAALEVLALLVSHVEKRILLRRKAKIMAELDIALNDCSRKVRTAAERTKMHWFNLVESGT